MWNFLKSAVGLVTTLIAVMLAVVVALVSLGYFTLK